MVENKQLLKSFFALNPIVKHYNGLKEENFVCRNLQLRPLLLAQVYPRLYDLMLQKTLLLVGIFLSILIYNEFKQLNLIIWTRGAVGEYICFQIRNRTA